MSTTAETHAVTATGAVAHLIQKVVDGRVSTWCSKSAMPVEGPLGLRVCLACRTRKEMYS